MAIDKLQGGVEDLLFGMGTTQQLRKGIPYTITQINASHIPYSLSVTVAQELARLGNTISPIQGNLDAHIADKNNPHEVTIEDVGGAPLEHQHAIEDVDFLQPELDNLQGQIYSHIHDERYYRENEYITESVGAAHALKPILLNSNGVLDPSFFDTAAFHYVGDFTPAAGFEYPDTVGHEAGAFWSVEGVNEVTGYTFVDPGNLLGKTVNNGDFMVWGTTGWAIMKGAMNPSLYYKLDGSQAITHPFAGGGQIIDNIAPGVDVLDAATMGQLGTVQTNLDNHEADLANPHAVTAAQAGAEPANANIQGHIADVTTNPHNVTAGQTGAEPADPLLQAHLVDIANPHAVTAAQAGAEPADSAIQAHLIDVTNPHAVTKAQVGLSLVDNTNDASKPISDATQVALDAKYDKVEHVNISVGLADAGKPVVLDSEGKLHPTISGNGLYPVAMYTPVVGSIATEYPDTTGESFGAYWGVTTDPVLGFTFTVGDLAGVTTFPNDSLILGSQGWGIFIAPTGTQDYYRLDGTVAITGPLAGGGQQLKNIAPATVAGDAVEFGQIASFATDFVAKAGDTMTGDLQIGSGVAGEGSQLIIRGNSADNAGASRIVMHREDGSLAGMIYNNPANNSLMLATYDALGASTGLVTLDNGGVTVSKLAPSTIDELTRKDYVDGAVSAHAGLTTNPHAVTKAQVGLDLVPNLDTTSAVANQHTHANKALLDTIISTGLPTNFLSEAGTYESVNLSAYGDMFKSVYDANDNGVVDDAEKLTGLTPAQLPVSTATQSALDAKLSKSGGTMTGEILMNEDIPIQGLVTSVAYDILSLGAGGLGIGNTSYATFGYGDWTFNNVPSCAVAPTSASHLVNKTALDTKPTGSWSWDGTTLAITIP